MMTTMIFKQNRNPKSSNGEGQGQINGRDKAKAKGNAMSSSDYKAKKLSLVEELAETNRVKKQAIKQFDQKIDKFYKLEQRKIMIGSQANFSFSQTLNPNRACNL
ncbi:hypothetical protein L1987_46536 [Smallanthus sonchifolius]|uniref:Uncharacterized protein n=1 Tax=Smallanthus sonchifolius TaxID=185202 RepID=A0ACB9FZV2_9ASTR|nr:hypothetical protein L1987_46536 [Smallanthus sonchifolius]